jgi:hypothetical protein
MYLARLQENGRWKYVIRASYYDDNQGFYRFRQVFDLGENPVRYMHLVTENVLYFDEALENAVEQEKTNDRDPALVLEELLWDFLPAEVRVTIRGFGRNPNFRLSPLSQDEKEEVRRFIHLFDRRRLFYIRYGAVDQSRIFRLNDKLYRPLLFKCRDEKEYSFKQLELSLPAREFKNYIFVIFNLQQHFSESFSVSMPEALDPVKLEKVFVKEICRLNADSGFWQDSDTSWFLRSHLEDYLIRFFDYDFERHSFDRYFFENFRAKHSSFRWPESREILSEEETSTVFGRKIGDLKKMKKLELARLFRVKAKEHHPDGGGEAEKFIQLLKAYESLKKTLGS